MSLVVFDDAENCRGNGGLRHTIIPLEEIKMLYKLTETVIEYHPDAYKAWVAGIKTKYLEIEKSHQKFITNPNIILENTMF